MHRANYFFMYRKEKKTASVLKVLFSFCGSFSDDILRGLISACVKMRLSLEMDLFLGTFKFLKVIYIRVIVVLG